jgi:hypothetical protein
MASPPPPPPDERHLRVDGRVQWLEETVNEGAQPSPRPPRRSSVLGAAMIAVGEIIEPEKTTVDIEIQVEASDQDCHFLPFVVGFGDLPELD